MTRAHKWQTSSQLHWLLPSASPWRGTAVGKPSSRSGQFSLQGKEVWSPQGQQSFARGSLFQQWSRWLWSCGFGGCWAGVCRLFLLSQQLSFGSPRTPKSIKRLMLRSELWDGLSKELGNAEKT